MITKEVVFYNENNSTEANELEFPNAKTSKYQNVIFIKGIPDKVKSSDVKSKFESYFKLKIEEKYAGFSDKSEDVEQIKNFVKQHSPKDFKTLEYINIFR